MTVYSLERLNADPVIFQDGRPALVLVGNFVLDMGKGARSILTRDEVDALAHRIVAALNSTERKP